MKPASAVRHSDALNTSLIPQENASLVPRIYCVSTKHTAGVGGSVFRRAAEPERLSLCDGTPTPTPAVFCQDPALVCIS